jgi:hypothetical protein
MRGRGDYSETYGYAEGLGVKTVGFRSNAPAGPKYVNLSKKFIEKKLKTEFKI